MIDDYKEDDGCEVDLYSGLPIDESTDVRMIAGCLMFVALSIAFVVALTAAITQVVS